MSISKPTTIPELWDNMKLFTDNMEIFMQAVMLRFDHTDTLLDVIATTVNRHENILNQHSQQFIEINQRLDKHEELLTRLTFKSDTHEELLDVLAEQSLHNMQILDRLDSQMKVNSERLNYVEHKVARLEFAK
ncbi:TPA: hypothetical protein DEP96_03910 [Candidatus Uhrbacteria bacterium]|nr:hypothetical protein [Candidatus Uhrbacteria bacterium]